MEKKKNGNIFSTIFALIGLVITLITIYRKFQDIMELVRLIKGDDDSEPASDRKRDQEKTEQKAPEHSQPPHQEAAVIPLVKPKVKAVQEQSSPSFQLSERQEEIYQLIRSKGEVSMAAVTSNISDVSPRTLRRDMTKLEKLGLIKRVGKTKDSVYKLKE